MMKFEARALANAALMMGPMNRLLGENEPPARVFSMMQDVQSARATGRIILCKEVFRFVGFAIWQKATDNPWLLSHREEIEQSAGVSLQSCATLVNLYLAKRLRGKGIGQRIEAAMLTDMERSGYSTHLNFGYSTDTMRSWLPHRPGTRELDVVGPKGDRIIVAPIPVPPLIQSA